LTRFAQILRDRGHHSKAKHTLAESLVIGDPITAISVLAVIDVGVIEFVMQYYMERTISQGKPDGSLL